MYVNGEHRVVSHPDLGSGPTRPKPTRPDPTRPNPTPNCRSCVHGNGEHGVLAEGNCKVGYIYVFMLFHLFIVAEGNILRLVILVIYTMYICMYILTYVYLCYLIYIY